MAWIAEWPVLTESVSGSPDQKRTNFEAIEDWWDVEHYTFTSGASGTHVPGKVATFFYGTQDEIDTLTIPGCGAIAYASDLGLVEIYNGSTWERITEDAYSRVRNVAADMTVPTATWTVIDTWETSGISGMYDTLDEWSYHQFTPVSAGYYVVTFSAIWEYTVGTSYQKAIGLFKNGVLYSQSRIFGYSALRNTKVDVVPMTVGDYLQLAAWHNAGAYRYIIFANIHIQRVS